jgi:ribokinase
VSDGRVVAVLGAINVDLVVSGAPLPAPGETVVGGVFAQHHGGKGGNQAVAAARALGDAGRAAMIGATGDDAFGSAARAALADDGVDVTWVTVDGERATGVALIAVDPGGENQISVAPGANATVDAERVSAALDALAPSVVLASLEVPAGAVRAAAEWCASRKTTFVLNPAPATEEAADLARLATYVTPNETERAALGDLPEAVTMIETLGAKGVRIHRDGAIRYVAAPRVEPVDTTGAGDCFNGVFAAGLLEGLELHDAVMNAVEAAARSTTIDGARAGMPARADLTRGN